jgi:nucleotide-binding universal stress UspA family protein
MAMFPTRVLVGVDTGAVSDHAVDAAWELCRATDSELHLAHVKLTARSMRGSPMGAGQQERLEDEGRAFLQHHVARVEQAGGRVAGTHVRFSRRIEDALVGLQAELGIGLLVLGAQTSGDLARRVIGALGPIAAEDAPFGVHVAWLPGT